jgi:hypothetical protein
MMRRIPPERVTTMEQQSKDAVARAVAFANGLRKNILSSGKRWTAWPRGANDLAKVIACVDGIQYRLQRAVDAGEGESAFAACIADLRAVLEWTTYQSASLATARAIVFARKTRTFAERFGLLDDPAASLAILVDSESSLIENVRTKNDYMTAIAERNPHLELPRPLVDVEHLSRPVDRPRGKLDLIQRLIKSAKEPR